MLKFRKIIVKSFKNIRMGFSFKNFNLALQKLCKFSKKIKKLGHNQHAGMPPQLRKGPQSFAHFVPPTLVLS